MPEKGAIMYLFVRGIDFASFYPATFYWNACVMPGKGAVMYMFVRDIYFASFYDFSIGF